MLILEMLTDLFCDQSCNGGLTTTFQQDYWVSILSKKIILPIRRAHFCAAALVTTKDETGLK